MRVDEAGNAIAVWTFRDTLDPSDRNHISTVSVRRRAAASGLWSAEELLQNDPSAFASDIHLAVEADGTAWAMWTQRTFEHEFFAAFDRYRIFARKFTPASAWGAAEAVSAEFAFRPTARVSTDKRGSPSTQTTTQS